MFDQRFLQSMYQQWCCGQSDVARQRWADFVELAAKHNGVAADAMMRELQKYRWFEWGDR
jgi:hypothetical protein